MDGMGVDMLEHNLPENSFLRSHIHTTITSVFPPTTTAATTSTYSGLTPLEHGFAGWQCYFEEYGRHITLFRNQDFYTEENLGFDVTKKHLPYQMLFEQIRNANAAKAYGVAQPWGDFKVSDFDELCEIIARLSTKDEENFILSYWKQPDGYMHQTGCYSRETKAAITQFNDKIEQLAAKLQDSLLIITADHGLIDIQKDVKLNDIAEIDACLRLAPGIEPRALAFYIKPECMEIFPTLFNQHFGEDFILLKTEEYLHQGYAGEGSAHPKFRGFLGDYMALAIGETILQYHSDAWENIDFKAHHAGLSEKEMLIPLIICEK